MLHRFGCVGSIWMVICVGIFSSVWSSVGVGASDWTSEAVRLTGESETIRSRAVRRLKSIPDLETVLRHELDGPNRFLAWDVITALDLHSLFEDLLIHSERDETGFSYHALNSLASTEAQQRLIPIYLARVRAPGTSLSARVILIESLGRLGAELPIDLVQFLLKDPSFEIRSATLSYLRLRMGKRPIQKEVGIILQFMRTFPFQLRVQARCLLEELDVVSAPGEVSKGRRGK